MEGGGSTTEVFAAYSRTMCLAFYKSVDSYPGFSIEPCGCFGLLLFWYPP